MSTTFLKALIIVGAVLYYAAFATSFSNKKQIKTLSDVFWGLGFAISISIVINNWVVNGYVPFVSMFQVLTFLGACYTPIYLYFSFARNGKWMRPYFMFAPAFIMTGLCFMDANSAWEYPPALQSPWFVPHVLMYMISYTLGFVAFLICVMSLFAKKKEDRLRLEEGAYDCICIVFPFMTFGMFFGAIWANEIWGHFWSWDTKESWSLVTWLTYMLYLHFRRHKSTKKYAKYVAMIGFVGIIITFFFVNMMNSTGSHTYSV